MEEIEKKLKSLRRRFENQEKELKRFLGLSPVNLEAVQALFQVFSELQTNLKVESEKKLEQMRIEEKTEEELNAEDDKIDDYLYRFHLMDGKVNKLLQNNEPKTQSVGNGSVTGEQKKSYKLPAMEIRKFDGTRTEWIGFWAQFERIHVDPELHDSVKFNYLLSALKEGSEARELASLYPQSAENYPKVIESLKKKYGNEDVLLQVYIRELLSLVISNVNSKEKLPIQTLYMKVDSHLRALKTLKLQNADPETWLYPLVESSLPDRVLYNWQHSSLSSVDGRTRDPPKSRLDLLMEFLEKEVNIHQNIQFARKFSQETAKNHAKTEERKSTAERDHLLKKPPATVAAFHVREKPCCIFCEKSNHASQSCYLAKRLTYEEKKNRLIEHGACFRCLDTQHKSFECQAKIKCDNCGYRHLTILCRSGRNESGESLKFDEKSGRYDSRAAGRERKNEKDSIGNENSRYVGRKDTKRDRREVASEEPSRKKQKNGDDSVKKSYVTLCTERSAVVFSQTLMVKLKIGNKFQTVRVFLDTGSKRSYIRKKLVEELGLVPHSHEKIVHCLFGGIETTPTVHGKYNIRLQSLLSDFSCSLTVRDKDTICYPLERLQLSENLAKCLKQNGIQLTDVGNGSPPIDLLIGSDFYGRIISNGIKNLNNGLVAINTKLGWTVVGEVKESTALQEGISLCLSVHDKQLPHLWDLELLGIRDPVEVVKGNELQEKIQTSFLKKVERKEDGRYLISLPWKEEHPLLPSNKDVAEKRLQSTTKKLVQNKLFDAYNALFVDWLKEGFIEKVTDDQTGENIHYLPHRAVIKDSLTTPVRPVFDASCKKGKNPSLNECLHKGCNNILSIPDILLRFRENEIGSTSDIRKAFQMIELKKEDRDCFRFLWWKSEEMAELETYRHVRVPFGATCSPFILGAILHLHLSMVADEDKKIAEKLKQNFYVDNCLASFSSVQEYECFRAAAVRIMTDAQMELRMWLSNADDTFPQETKIVSVLGLLWNREKDELFIDSSKLSSPEIFTKRTTLSVLQRIFDPVGFTCPVTLMMKAVLQRTWASKLKWDEPLPELEKKIAERWCKELMALSQIKIPRLIKLESTIRDNWSIHVFTDASKDAYATAIFLRSKINGKVKVQLLGAKSRIAPPKKITIPRLELLGSLIGAYLYSTIQKALDIAAVRVFFWCDSTTVLAWIKRNDQWGTYVGNRIKKILTFSRVEDWRYVPSALNAADLPTRGCSPAELLKSKWWEGPSWLYSEETDWPSWKEEVNEKEVQMETAASKINVSISIERQQKVNYSFKSWVRVTAWANRFIHNCRQGKIRSNLKIDLENGKCKLPTKEDIEPLSEDEIDRAEITLMKVIQLECVDEVALRKANLFQIVKDEMGILRVKTRIVQRNDLHSFKYPAILPGKHPLVRRLIMDLHLENVHAGVGTLLVILREKYWILQGRRTVQKVLYKCLKCRRFSAKPIVTETAALPINRVKDAEPFEITGVDLAGPLFLKNGKKTWMVIFTCAVFRAVHLRLVDSLTTTAFIKSMGEFILQFRRPAVIYSDNGTNFKGTDNLFAKLDWKAIRKNDGLERIKWIFNPSMASWWGGFWERLIRSTKDLVRKTLGKASLKKPELEALLKTVEKVLNERPLTYVSEHPEDLEPLTPSLFFHPFGSVEFPEKELTEADKLRFRLKYVQTLKGHLMSRFRSEYLGLLVGKSQKANRQVKVGELVVVSTENKKRVEWPLARVVELMPSKVDGISRVAKIRTQAGIFTRPVQRLHPLEAETEDEEIQKIKERVTRSGRVVRPPVRFE